MKTYTYAICAMIIGIGALLGMYAKAFAATEDALQATTTVFATTTTASMVHSQPMIPACLSINQNLSYGATDASSNNQITLLQEFLSTNGYFDASQVGTGHFGPLTRTAVIHFQTANGVPGTGYVGTLTRAAILKTQGSACTSLSDTQRAPVLYSVNPTKAAVGDTVSVTGFGFASSSTILLDGMVIARDVPISSSRAISCTTNSDCHGGINQTISFTLPSSAAPYCAPRYACPMYVRLLSAGNYQLSVRSNESTTSNALPFTITKGTLDTAVPH